MPLDLRFLGQPGPQQSTIGTFLPHALGDDGIDTLTLVVAWARFRGVVRIRRHIEAFRARGGKMRLIVGIDEGGATRPGLLLARQLFDEASVFHDSHGGTFHPKIYLAHGARRAVLVVGSSNATPGGWFTNYEASMEARFDLPEDAAHPALQGAHAYISSLESETALLRPLTEELVDQLVRDRRFNVSGHERNARGRRSGSVDNIDAADIDDSGSIAGATVSDDLFGRRTGPRPTIPTLSDQARLELKSLELPVDDEAEDDESIAIVQGDINQAPHTSPTTSSSVPPPLSVATWSKVLPRGDAQQHPPPTNPTGNVRLTQAGNDIDWRTWFRTTLFATAQWQNDVDRKHNRIEQATIPFDVTIAGVQSGVINLIVTHAAHRESGQSNHTTALHWGPLMPALRAFDYTGFTLTLERKLDGRYTLDLS